MNIVLRIRLILRCLEVTLLVLMLPLLLTTPIREVAPRLHGQAALKAVSAYQRAVILFGRI